MSSQREVEVSFRGMPSDFPSTTCATFSLYQYPAKFIPQVVEYVLKKYGSRRSKVFDPFAGYGTVGIVSRIYGMDYELWDLNPMLQILHDTSTMELKDIDLQDLISKIKSSKETFLPKWENIGYWHPEPFLRELSRIWGFYHSLDDEWIKLLISIPFLKTTRYFSYDDPQRQKLSKSPKSQARIAELLRGNFKAVLYGKIESEIRGIISRLKEYWRFDPKPVEFAIKSGIDVLEAGLDGDVDLMITSPPYLQAHEYIRRSKLDLTWLGFSMDYIRDLASKEIPYRDPSKLPQIEICSPTLDLWREKLSCYPKLRRIFDCYFRATLGALTKLQSKVKSYLCFFLGAANLRGNPVPIHQIFLEHFQELGWRHEITLRDRIVSRRMFKYQLNPATGIRDQRMCSEVLLVLRK